jgi:hypothetical protein
MRVKLGKTEGISYSFYLDDTIQDAGTVAVTVIDASGNTVYSTSVANVANVYTFTLPAQNQLGTLTVNWVGTLSDITELEVVSSHLLELWELNAYLTLKGYGSSIDVTTKKHMRDVCADSFDSVVKSSFVTRRKTARVSTRGNSTVLPDIGVLQVLTVDGAAFTGTVTPAGVVTLTNSSSGTWCGSWGSTDSPDTPHTFVYDVVHPWCTAGVPEDIHQAALEHTTALLGYRTSKVPDNTEVVALEHMTYRPVIAGSGNNYTGIPRVDAVLKRYRFSDLAVY